MATDRKRIEAESIWQGMTSATALDAVLEAGAENDLVAQLKRKMVAAIGEARDEYFRKPTVSLPFGVSAEDSAALLKSHSELREIVMEKHESVLDGAFRGTKHLAVNRVLRNLLSAGSVIVEDPVAHMVVLHGVEPCDHSFVFRSNVPLVRYEDRNQLPSTSRLLGIADLWESTETVPEILKYMLITQMSEWFIIAPYDKLMWTMTGSVVSSGGYSFEWIDPRARVRSQRTKPMRLHSKFFVDEGFSSWRLVIRPFGSSLARAIPRDHFSMLFSGWRTGMFVETRSIRNGFADVSIIRPDGEFSPEAVDLSAHASALMRIDPGRQALKKIPFVKAEVLPGRHMDLASALPLSVRLSFYERLMQTFLRMKPSRQFLPALVRAAHASSAFAVYNGAVMVADSLVPVEELCSTVEDIVYYGMRAKQRISESTAAAKINPTTDPKDYAISVLSWLVTRSVDSANVEEGFRKVVDSWQRFAAGVNAPAVAGSSDNALVDIPPQPIALRSLEDEAKEAYLRELHEFAEDVFGNSVEVTEYVRQEWSWDENAVFDLRMSLARYSEATVDPAVVQVVYDDLFPGNSVTDATQVQAMAELGDFSFAVDVPYYRMPLSSMLSPLHGYLVVPPVLRTSVGADLMHSFRSLMGSLMKRNFNRPRPEAAGDRKRFVELALSRVVSTYGRSSKGLLQAAFNNNPVNVSPGLVNAWAAKHTVAEVQAAASQLARGVPDPSGYRLMPKDRAKPSLSLEAQSMIQVGQTVVYHSKDVISLTVGMFTVCVSRFLALFDVNIRFAFGADEAMCGAWADRYLDMPGVHVYEIDIPKFDKSQDWACFELILAIMEMTGLESSLVSFWRKASEDARVFSSLFGIVFHTMYGNRSGSGGTLSVNCLVITVAFLYTFMDLEVVALLVKGDDTVLVTRRAMQSRHEEALRDHWGFSMKNVAKRNVTGFCSAFFVKDSRDKYQLVRDPVRVLEKLGRALPLDKPASFFIDYYVSMVESVLPYEDPMVLSNMTSAVASAYGRAVDVDSIVSYVRFISSSSFNFLRHHYGMTVEQIGKIRELDDVIEVLQRSRTTRFTKGKALADDYRSVRLSLVDKMMMDDNWFFDSV